MKGKFMPLKEKLERNKQMYLDKFGFQKIGDTKPTRVPKSYRQICTEQNICVKRAQDIVNKYRDEYGPDREE
jgi:hypothetical protein